MANIKQYLVSKGIAEKEIVFSAVIINKEFDRVKNNDKSESTVFTGFNLSQHVNIESKKGPVL